MCSWSRRRAALSAGRCIKAIYRNLMSKLSIKQSYIDQNMKVPEKVNDEMYKFDEFVNDWLLPRYHEFRVNFSVDDPNLRNLRDENLIHLFSVYMSMQDVLRAQHQYCSKLGFMHTGRDNLVAERDNLKAERDNLKARWDNLFKPNPEAPDWLSNLGSRLRAL